jgi:hypothetical protein
MRGESVGEALFGTKTVGKGLKEGEADVVPAKSPDE